MTIFKQKVDEESLTVAETKAILEELERERAADEDREMRYELARAIEHVNRFAVLDPEESLEFIDEPARTREGRRADRIQDRESPTAGPGRAPGDLRTGAVHSLGR